MPLRILLRHNMLADNSIHRKIAGLIRLAKRPGTPQEGETARQLAIELCLKYGLTCEFTVGVPKPASTRPTASATPPVAAQRPQSQSPEPSSDALFYRWIKALSEYGWLITQTEDTKIGRMIRFRKPGFNSEIRITQRGGGKDFEAEHIMRPDPDQYGKDWSYCTFMTISLGELLRHLEFSRGTPITKREWQYTR